MDLINVFVTYSWDNDTNIDVYAFVDFLRKKGFNATCDRTVMERESTSNFIAIMSDGLLSTKIIVILSESYKKKAESSTGGVGIEYRIISSDLANNPNKYIFVSFVGTSADTRCKIVPKMYESYSIIDIAEDEKNNYNTLISKIKNEPVIAFSPIAEKTPDIVKQELPSFTLKNRLCIGYGESEGNCQNQSISKNKKLCESCSKREYRDHIMEYFNVQAFSTFPCSNDSFIAVLKYGFVTSCFFIKTFSQQSETECYKEIAGLHELIEKESTRTGLIINQTQLIFSSGINPVTKIIADQQKFVYKTEEELIHDMMDLSSYFGKLINEYEQSDLKEHYIELYSDGDPLIRIVNDFLTNTASNALLLLGDYGCGKTSFCIDLTYRLIKKYQSAQNQYIPIMIRLKDYSKALSMDNLLTDFFVNKYRITNGNMDTFRQLLMNSKVLLIFDGFDEIAKRVDYDVKYSVYKEICRYAFGNTKIVLTCRPNYFQDQHEYERLFKSSYLHYEPDNTKDLEFEKVYISEFTAEQIKSFIDSYEREIQSKISLDEFYEKLQTTHDLNDLAKRPFLLNIIVKTLPDLIAKGFNSRVNTATIYDTYTKIWLDREEKKGKTLINSSDKKLFCENLAYGLYMSNESSIHFSNLPEIIKSHFKGLNNFNEIDYFSHDIQSCSFLSADGEGNFSFIHNSFMEYFVANVIVKKMIMLRDKKRDNELKSILGENLVSMEIGLFIADILWLNESLRHNLLLRLKESLSKTQDMKIIANSLSILAKSGEDIGEILSKMTKNDLRNIDLSYAFISDCTIKDLDFDYASFYKAKLSNVKFESCSFINANFEQAELGDVILKGLDLFATNWSNAKVRHSNFARANLVDTDLSDTIFTGCNFMSSDMSNHNLSDNSRFKHCSFESAIGVPYY